MIKFISSNQPAAQIVTVLLVFANIFIFIFTEHNFQQSLVHFHDASRYANLWDIPMISFAVNVLLILFSVILVSYIFNSREFFDKNTYLPGFFYFVLLSFFKESLTDYDFILGLTLFLLAMHQILKIKQNEDARKISFDAVFLIGIAVFFNPLYAFFLPFFWIALNSVRPFVWREMALSIAGFLCALLIIYIFSPEVNLIKEEYIFSHSEAQELRFLFFIISFFLFMGFAVIYLLKYSSRTSIRFKRLVRMLFILLFFGIFSASAYWLNFKATFQFALIIAPASFLFAIPILYTKSNKIANYLLWLVLVCSFLVYFF